MKIGRRKRSPAWQTFVGVFWGVTLALWLFWICQVALVWTGF